MSKHRAAAPVRPAGVAGGRRRAAGRSRRRRGVLLGALAGIVPTLTIIAVFGVLGAEPGAQATDATPASDAQAGSTHAATGPAEGPADGTADELPDARTTPSAEEGVGAAVRAARAATAPDAALERGTARRAAPGGTAVTDEVPLPPGSGTGRRAVFSESLQRVWIVGADGQVQRTYLASGSIYDNLDPGTYEVYSRSEQAYGIDDSGTMRWFVRFTQGDNGAAIGFHSIPEKDGEPVQTVQQLGTPLSHGCIRQREADARAMWEFAGLGTTVVVTA